jgi:hypothetical protein
LSSKGRSVIDLAASRHAAMAPRSDSRVLVRGHDLNQLFGEDPISATPLELFRIPGLREIGAGLDRQVRALSLIVTPPPRP